MNRLKDIFKKTIKIHESNLSEIEKSLYDTIVSIIKNEYTRIHNSLDSDIYFIECEDTIIEIFFEDNYIVIISKSGFFQTRISDKLNNMIMKEYKKLSRSIINNYKERILDSKNSYINTLKYSE